MSPGCAHCYAETWANRFGQVTWGPNGTRRVASDATWKEPVRWDAEARESGTRPRVFCASLADVFEDWNGPMLANNGNPLWFKPQVGWIKSAPAGGPLVTMQNVRSRLAQLILDTPNLDWLLLTKRPQNVNDMWPLNFWPKNVRVGTTVENQEQADIRLPHLFGIPAKMRFLSVEPMLGPIDFGFGRIWCRHHNRFEPAACMDESQPCFRWQANAGDMVSWAIFGGESGSQARPFNAHWLMGGISQCRQWKVAPFVKQLGGNPSVGELQPLRDRKGGDWDEWPPALRIRELPEPVR